MSTISKPLTGILFNEAALALASAPFKSNLNAVYGFNAAGTAYTLFKPSSNFNSLQQLAPDGSYIVDAATPGFDLPGAVLTATSAGTPAPKLTLVEYYSGYDPNAQPGSFYYVRVKLTSSAASDTTASVLLAKLPQVEDADRKSVATWAVNVPLGQLVDLPFTAIANSASGIAGEDPLLLFALAPSGALVHQQFSFENPQQPGLFPA
jgi:hypothetical protein